jgi:hypothetical protein
MHSRWQKIKQRWIRMFRGNLKQYHARFNKDLYFKHICINQNYNFRQWQLTCRQSHYKQRATISLMTYTLRCNVPEIRMQLTNFVNIPRKKLSILNFTRWRHVISRWCAWQHAKAFVLLFCRDDLPNRYRSRDSRIWPLHSWCQSVHYSVS